jgi:hypothetical protein
MEEVDEVVEGGDGVERSGGGAKEFEVRQPAKAGAYVASADVIGEDVL